MAKAKPSPRKCPKEYYIKQEFYPVETEIKKVLAAKKSIGDKWPLIDCRQTEGSKAADIPVPLNKTGSMCLLYGRGALTRRKRVMDMLAKVVTDLQSMGVTSQIVTPIPQAVKTASENSSGKNKGRGKKK